jgi:CheY-like chemotaxis protein
MPAAHGAAAAVGRALKEAALHEIERPQCACPQGTVNTGGRRAKLSMVNFPVSLYTKNRMGPVLVAEDDHEIREALEALLGEVGFHVLTAADGRQALELLRQHAGSSTFPAVLLLDLMMPVMNGWEVLAELKKDPVLASLPVVIVSAFAEQAPRGNGVRAVLRKPVQVETLLKTLEAAVAP